MTNWTASSLLLLLLLQVGWCKDGQAYRLLSAKVKGIVDRIHPNSRSGAIDTNTDEDPLAEESSNKRSLDGSSSTSPFLPHLATNPIEPALLLAQKTPQQKVQTLSTARLQQQQQEDHDKDALARTTPFSLADYRGGSSSIGGTNELEFFPIASLLLSGSVVVAFHLQSPQSHHLYTLAGAFQQPYRLWTNHWIHMNEAHFFSNVVNILTHGILLEKALGALNFLEATLWALLTTSLGGALLMPVSNTLALAHDQGVGFSSVVCFWMGMAMGTPGAFWWHRVGSFLGIVVADVLLFTNRERGTLHHWIGVVNGLLYAAYKQYWPQLKTMTATIRMKNV